MQNHPNSTCYETRLNLTNMSGRKFASKRLNWETTALLPVNTKN